jgi:hypothetical protein
MPILPNEARLLFMASRPDAVCSETYLAALAASGPDWRLVGALAEREKLLPILWAYMRDHAELVPENVREAFRRQAVVTEFRMAATETTVHKILQELDGIGVRVMLLKGAALAATVYGSFTKRPMGDVDILVAPEDAARAWNHVRGLGWTLEYEDGDAFYDSFHHLPALVDPTALRLVLEIHRSMMPKPGPFDLDEAALWRDAEPVRLGTTTTWVPSQPHQLLHLSVHFAWSHMFRGIGRTVRDVAAVIAARPVDWDRFTELVVRSRAATCAYWTLAITRTLTGTPVPDAVLESVRPRQPMLVTRILERAFVSMGLFGTCPSLRASHVIWSVGIRPGASGHGDVRPWHASDQFQSVFGIGTRPDLGARLAGQLQLAGRWWRFAQTIVSPGRIA